MDTRLDILLSGVLEKRGSTFGRWVKRFYYVVYHNGTYKLCYKRHESDIDFVGELLLLQFDVLLYRNENAFMLETQDKVVVLRATTAKERSRWIGQLTILKNRSSFAHSSDTILDSNSLMRCFHCQTYTPPTIESYSCDLCHELFCFRPECFNPDFHGVAICTSCQRLVSSSDGVNVHHDSAGVGAGVGVGGGVHPSALGHTSQSLASVSSHPHDGQPQQQQQLATAAGFSTAATTGTFPTTTLNQDPDQLVNSLDVDQIVCTVVRAQGLHFDSHLKINCHPYCVIRVDKNSARTKTIRSSHTPQWDFSCQFPLSRTSDVVQISVFHNDLFGAHTFLGSASIPIAHLQKKRLYEAWFILSKTGKSHSSNTTTQNRGKVLVQLLRLGDGRLYPIDVAHQRLHDTLTSLELASTWHYIGRFLSFESPVLLGVYYIFFVLLVLHLPADYVITLIPFIYLVIIFASLLDSLILFLSRRKAAFILQYQRLHAELKQRIANDVSIIESNSRRIGTVRDIYGRTVVNPLRQVILAEQHNIINQYISQPVKELHQQQRLERHIAHSQQQQQSQSQQQQHSTTTSARDSMNQSSSNFNNGTHYEDLSDSKVTTQQQQQQHHHHRNHSSSLYFSPQPVQIAYSQSSVMDASVPPHDPINGFSTSYNTPDLSSHGGSSLDMPLRESSTMTQSSFFPPPLSSISSSLASTNGTNQTTTTSAIGLGVGGNASQPSQLYVDYVDALRTNMSFLTTYIISFWAPIQLQIITAVGQRLSPQTKQNISLVWDFCFEWASFLLTEDDSDGMDHTMMENAATAAFQHQHFAQFNNQSVIHETQGEINNTAIQTIQTISGDDTALQLPTQPSLIPSNASLGGSSTSTVTTNTTHKRPSRKITYDFGLSDSNTTSNNTSQQQQQQGKDSSSNPLNTVSPREPPTVIGTSTAGTTTGHQTAGGNGYSPSHLDALHQHARSSTPSVASSLITSPNNISSSNSHSVSSQHLHLITSPPNSRPPTRSASGAENQNQPGTATTAAAPDVSSPTNVNSTQLTKNNDGTTNHRSAGTRTKDSSSTGKSNHDTVAALHQAHQSALVNNLLSELHQISALAFHEEEFSGDEDLFSTDHKTLPYHQIAQLSSNHHSHNHNQQQQQQQHDQQYPHQQNTTRSNRRQSGDDSSLFADNSTTSAHAIAHAVAVPPNVSLPAPFASNASLHHQQSPSPPHSNPHSLSPRSTHVSQLSFLPSSAAPAPSLSLSNQTLPPTSTPNSPSLSSPFTPTPITSPSAVSPTALPDPSNTLSPSISDPEHHLLSGAAVAPNHDLHSSHLSPIFETSSAPGMSSPHTSLAGGGVSLSLISSPQRLDSFSPFVGSAHSSNAPLLPTHPHNANAINSTSQQQLSSDDPANQQSFMQSTEPLPPSNRSSPSTYDDPVGTAAPGSSSSSLAFSADGGTAATNIGGGQPAVFTPVKPTLRPHMRSNANMTVAPPAISMGGSGGDFSPRDVDNGGSTSTGSNSGFTRTPSSNRTRNLGSAMLRTLNRKNSGYTPHHQRVSEGTAASGSGSSGAAVVAGQPISFLDETTTHPIPAFTPISAPLEPRDVATTPGGKTPETSLVLSAPPLSAPLLDDAGQATPQHLALSRMKLINGDDTFHRDSSDIHDDSRPVLHLGGVDLSHIPEVPTDQIGYEPYGQLLGVGAGGNGTITGGDTLLPSSELPYIPPTIPGGDGHSSELMFEPSYSMSASRDQSYCEPPTAMFPRANFPTPIHKKKTRKRSSQPPDQRQQQQGSTIVQPGGREVSTIHGNVVWAAENDEQLQQQQQTQDYIEQHQFDQHVRMLSSGMAYTSPQPPIDQSAMNTTTAVSPPGDINQQPPTNTDTAPTTEAADPSNSQHYQPQITQTVRPEDAIFDFNRDINFIGGSPDAVIHGSNDKSSSSRHSVRFDDDTTTKHINNFAVEETQNTALSANTPIYRYPSKKQFTTELYALVLMLETFVWLFFKQSESTRLYIRQDANNISNPRFNQQLAALKSTIFWLVMSIVIPTRLLIIVFVTYLIGARFIELRKRVVR